MLGKIAIPHSLRVAEILTFVFCFGLSSMAVVTRIYTKAIITKCVRAEDCEYYWWHKDGYFAGLITKSEKISWSLLEYYRPPQTLKRILTPSPAELRGLYRAWD